MTAADTPGREELLAIVERVVYGPKDMAPRARLSERIVDAILPCLAAKPSDEGDQRCLDDMTLAHNVREATIGECKKIADGWIDTFGGVPTKYLNARDYAVDAVKDISDAISALSTTGEKKP